jgi:hypothetical protein
MSRLPIPSQGQPIDVSYLAQIANVVNDLASAVAVKPSTSSKIATNSSNSYELKETSSLSVVTGTVGVTSSTKIAQNVEQSFSYSFGVNFKYPPVVTATIVRGTGTGSPKNYMHLIIDSVSTSSLTGLIKTTNPTAETLDFSINIIAIGIPA